MRPSVKADGLEHKSLAEPVSLSNVLELRIVTLFTVLEGLEVFRLSKNALNWYS